jgi:preprotein translocase subunit SecE
VSESGGRTATPERPRPAAPRRRRRSPWAWLRAKLAGLSLFVRQVVAELRKVVWPTRQQLITYTIVVLVFVAAMMAFTSLLDLAFGWVMFEIFA